MPNRSVPVVVAVVHVLTAVAVAVAAVVAVVVADPGFHTALSYSCSPICKMISCMP